MHLPGATVRHALARLGSTALDETGISLLLLQICFASAPARRWRPPRQAKQLWQLWVESQRRRDYFIFALSGGDGCSIHPKWDTVFHGAIKYPMLN